MTSPQPVVDNRPWQRRQSDVAFVDRGADRVAMIDLLNLAEPPIILEDASAEIWRLLEAPRLLTELVHDLVDRYGAPREAVKAGVFAFLTDLDERGLLEPFPLEVSSD